MYAQHLSDELTAQRRRDRALGDGSTRERARVIQRLRRGSVMIVESERFGTIDIDEADLIQFPAGIIGFPGEHHFVMVQTRESALVAWLQSVTSPWFALPVVSLDVLDIDMTNFELTDIAKQAGLAGREETLAVMCVLNVSALAGATVNLVAPIVVDSETRAGAQILLDATKYSTQEIFKVRPEAAEAEAEAAAAAGGAAASAR
jgi:flagellar assembly factor FliW